MERSIIRLLAPQFDTSMPQKQAPTPIISFARTAVLFFGKCEESGGVARGLFSHFADSDCPYLSQFLHDIPNECGFVPLPTMRVRSQKGGICLDQNSI